MKLNIGLTVLGVWLVNSAYAYDDAKQGGGLRGPNAEGRKLPSGGNGNGNSGGNGNGNGGQSQNKGEPTGRVIISRKTEKTLKAQGKSPNEIAAIRAKGLNKIKQKKVVFESKGEGDFQVVEVGLGQEEAFIKDLLANDDEGLFEYAEADLLHMPVIVPSDGTQLSSQYHHNLMKSYDAWDLETGSTQVTVGICDTGLQPNHPDLEANRLPGYHATVQCWEDDASCTADVSDVHPHGTMCAGCAAAIGNNGVGLSGVGWSFKHRPGRVSDSSGGGAASSVLADCARRMCEKPDVKVASVSYSGVEQQSRRDAATYCKSQGALMVNAAGNDGRDLTQFGEADADDLIVAGASTSTDSKSGFSAYGRFIDVWAPGSSVWTTTTGSGYAAVSGTSFSCPLVAGLIALIWSKNPSLTPNEVESILKQSTDNVGIQGAWNTAYGRINSLKAMQAAGSGTPFPTPSPTTPPPTSYPTAPPPGYASFDPTLGVPRCTEVGPSCFSGNLLNSRGTAMSPAESNPSNTIDGCVDGNAGSYHDDESNDAIEVSSVGGGPLKVGEMATIKATVWAWSNGGSDTADFYVTDGASSPVWSYKGSGSPLGGGSQVIESAPFEVTSTLMTARVRFRYGGSPDPCSNGSYDDADDLVFAAAPDATVMYDVVCGSTAGSCSSNPVIAAAQDELHEVRCCADSFLGTGWAKISGCNVWGESEVNGVCQKSKTFAEAASLCASVGARLCTRDELLGDCTRGTGCSHDSAHNWSSSPPDLCTDDASCDDGLECTVNSCGANGLCQTTPVPSCGNFVVCGSATNTGCPAPRERQASPSDGHEVRCCSDTAKTGWRLNGACQAALGRDVWGESDVPSCNNGKTLAEAEAVCAAAGARLCTREEILADCTQGSGCQFDKEHVWTSTSFTGTPQDINGGGDGDTVTGSTVSAASTTYATSDSVFN